MTVQRKMPITGRREYADDDILKSLLGETLTSYSDPFNGESRITDAELVSEILQEIRNKLKGIQGIGDRLYVYATTEIWDLEIEFFATEEKLADFFIDAFGTAEDSYESMADEELDDYYDWAEEADFYDLPYIEIGFSEE